MEFYLMTWDESYQVGVSEIDRQHRQLFELINNLSQAVTSGYGEDIIGEVLVEMAAYADEHFKSEQLFLEKHPDYQAHFLKHWEFTKKCMELVLGFRRDKSVSWETLNYLAEWLQEHILQEDQRYFRELAELGLLE